MTEAFYQNIAGFHQFAELTDSSHFHPAPQDWQVVVCDIVNSTQAIAQGRYKQVNLVGAAVIMAVLNVRDGVDIPYAFGGDGATILIPGRLLGAVKEALEAVQAKVAMMLELELRAGCVPVAALLLDGATLSVGRFFLSEHMSQAVFHGTALARAEAWLKKGGGEVLLCNPAAKDNPNLEGLECRWEPIANRNGMMLSVMVRALPVALDKALAVHATILKEIGAIYPDETALPVTADKVRISLSPRRLWAEVLLRSDDDWFSRARYLLKILALNLVGWLSFASGKAVGGFEGQKYLSEMAANSDARKFDDCLRMVVDSTPAQRDRLEALLDTHYRKGDIVYGMHASGEALMTCLVFNLTGDHVHFVDGGDGGYAMAAVQMKQQLKQRAEAAA